MAVARIGEITVTAAFTHGVVLRQGFNVDSYPALFTRLFNGFLPTFDERNGHAAQPSLVRTNCQQPDGSKVLCQSSGEVHLFHADIALEQIRVSMFAAPCGLQSFAVDNQPT